MSEWWTYSLSDFLLFSPRTYYRLFELYNESLWPAHLLALAAAASLLLLARRGGGLAGRAAFAALALAWAWIAVAFHAERFVTINWAAIYYAYAFALQALMLLWFATAGARADIKLDGSFAAGAGFALFLFAAVIQPLIGPLLGRDWRQVEIVGLAPDPTTIATLAVLCMASRVPWVLLPIPLLWCAMTGLTLWTMEAPDALVTPAAGALALIAVAWKTVSRS
jgi:hypothetical protein